MKRLTVILAILFTFCFINEVSAQCSICTRTASQMGERPAKALNTGILYLAAAPMTIAGFIFYRWWKSAAR